MSVSPGTALDRLLEVVVVLTEDMRQDVERRGLTPARTHALWVLAELGPVPQRALAQALGVSARNITGIVDGLVGTGFVTREPHPGDRRATLVTLTAKGVTTTADLRQAREDFAQLLFGAMPTARRAEFVQDLDDVLAAIRCPVSRAPSPAETR